MGHARALLGLTDLQEIERIANKIVAEGLSVRATEELISVGDSKKISSKKNLSSLGKYQELEEKIGDALDTRVKIKGGANGGKIQIEFADSEDLLRIAKKLS
jgi:ParB family chromosome partitioning protein